MTIKEKEEILKEAKDRFDISSEMDKDNRKRCLSDLQFFNGDQWEKKAEENRKLEERPIITINKIPSFVDIVTGEARINKQNIKVVGVDENSDPYTANTIEGLIRNIEWRSFAQMIYDMSLESAASCARAFFRVLLKYTNDEDFQQEIVLARIPNQFSVYWDTMAVEQIDFSTINWAFILEELLISDYEKKYPGKSISGDEFKKNIEFWNTDVTKTDKVIIAEYFRKKEVSKEVIYYTKSGKSSKNEKDAMKDDNGNAIKREVKKYRIEWFKISGNDILSGPVIWAGDYIPIVPVWGKEINEGAKRILRSITTNAKDANRLYNYFRTIMAEIAMMSPKNPYIGTAKQFAGHEHLWNQSAVGLRNILIYNSDPQAPGAPKRDQPLAFPSALRNELDVATQDLKDTTGIYNAGRGDVSNEKSGVAIRERKEQGQVANFAYSDNLMRAITYLGKILVNLIPKVYREPGRIVRILGYDESEKKMPINVNYGDDAKLSELMTKYNLDPKKAKGINGILNGLNIGKYDVTINTGPSYNTQREEAADRILEFAKSLPDELRINVMDLVAESLDFPGKDKLIERLKKLVDPRILEKDEDDEQEMEEIQEPAIDPLIAIKIQQEEAKLKQENFEVDKKKIEVEKMSLEKLLVKKQLTST